jgi:hypothetical protein
MAPPTAARHGPVPRGDASTAWGDDMLAQGNDAFVDAIEILKTDHKRLAQCFSEFFASRSESRRYELIIKTCAALRVHIALEAEIFYPEFLNATEDTLSHFVAFVSHETVKKLVEGIENADPAGEGFSAQVYELSQLVAHHIREAEKPDGLFAEAQASNMDRDWVGKALLVRRQELAGMD